MKKKLQFFLLSLVAVTFVNAQDLIVVDLAVANQVTITAGPGLSASTISGSDSTGFYLEDFFTSDQTFAEVLVSGDLTSAANTPDLSPDLFRGGGGTDPGLNIWSYTDDPTSDFTAGQVAFSGQATWTLSVDEYNAMTGSSSSGNIYFAADTVDDIAGGATLIGTYSVINNPLSIPDVQSFEFSYYPNPVTDVLNITSQKMIEQVEVYNMLGQYVSVQKLNALNGTIKTANLANGAYFFRSTFQDGTVKTFKVIKKEF
ncbi:T9SS type A sorting domain-containing protein [Lacinutrix iliipiscaria]|uniref:T9SS type A sorting domain-containing protein n=1 Tax=Lacinutrix iliipiscaria TaxID=1230532 RepID=A0ABW5WLP2_9FLAO